VSEQRKNTYTLFSTAQGWGAEVWIESMFEMFCLNQCGVCLFFPFLELFLFFQLNKISPKKTNLNCLNAINGNLLHDLSKWWSYGASISRCSKEERTIGDGEWEAEKKEAVNWGQLNLFYPSRPNWAGTSLTRRTPRAPTVAIGQYSFKKVRRLHCVPIRWRKTLI